MELKYGFTKRRFPYVTFKDRYDAECSIQLSSLATDNAIWFGVDNANPQIMAWDAHRLGLEHLLSDGPERLHGWVAYPIIEEVLFTTRMHLTQEQVKALLPILQFFAEHGTFPTPEEVENARGF